MPKFRHKKFDVEVDVADDLYLDPQVWEQVRDDKPKPAAKRAAKK